jgi:hypothetical protein
MGEIRVEKNIHLFYYARVVIEKQGLDIEHSGALIIAEAVDVYHISHILFDHIKKKFAEKHDVDSNEISVVVKNIIFYKE